MTWLLRRWLADRRGASAVEFALIAPVFVGMMVGVVEAGGALRTGLQARQAAAAGAAYASKHTFDATAIAAASTAATAKTGLTTSAAQYCGCPMSSGFSTTCTGVCADGYAPRSYVVVTASLPRPRVFRTSFGLPSRMIATSTTLPGR